MPAKHPSHRHQPKRKCCSEKETSQAVEEDELHKAGFWGDKQRDHRWRISGIDNNKFFFIFRWRCSFFRSRTNKMLTFAPNCNIYREPPMWTFQVYLISKMKGLRGFSFLLISDFCLMITFFLLIISNMKLWGGLEQGGVEEGEAGEVHDPQVLQGEKTTSYSCLIFLLRHQSLSVYKAEVSVTIYQSLFVRWNISCLLFVQLKHKLLFVYLRTVYMYITGYSQQLDYPYIAISICIHQWLCYPWIAECPLTDRATSHWHHKFLDATYILDLSINSKFLVKRQMFQMDFLNPRLI